PPVEGGLAALARRHAGDDVRAVFEHRGPVARALPAREPVDDGPARAIDQDAHAAAPFDAATACAAATSRVSAVWNWASRRSTAASAAFARTIGRTIGTSRVCWPRASMRPRATSSPRVIPPKMFTRIAFTL